MKSPTKEPKPEPPPEPQPEPHQAVLEAFRRRTVLITGAAGSIGSELARQAAALPIAHLLLLDRDENGLSELVRFFDVRRSGGSAARSPSREMKITAVLGDIRDPGLVQETFARFRPDIVLHGAAYKHVPMMESNPCEAVLNNVTGTRILADAAIGAGSERFLLISTDKASAPAGIMGATKRVAELLVQQRVVQQRTGLAGKTVAASVRFVNVTGSRGSVVPIFREQIAAGGPVTLTHEEMARYFIAVERAAQLLLESATLEEPGAIYLLEAGAPVRILDLARRLIAEAGPAASAVAVETTGLRPGEKLREQLRGANELLARTVFEGIDAVASRERLRLDPALLARLEDAAGRREPSRVVELLRQLPIDYCPVNHGPGQP